MAEKFHMRGGEKSFLSQEEVDFLQTTKLHRRTPYLIAGVSWTQLSVARHFGGCSYNGNFYTYVPPTDELVREDVVKAIMERREPKKKRPPRKSRLPREAEREGSET